MRDVSSIVLLDAQRRLSRALAKAQNAKKDGYPEAYGILSGAVEDVLETVLIAVGELADVGGEKDATAATVAE